MLINRFLLLSALAGTVLAHTSGNVQKREQPGVPKTPKLDLNPLHWGDVNFIHTTDTHGWLEGHLSEQSYNGDLGDFYSFAVRMKEKAHKLKKDLFIVDTGDLHDGNGLSDVTPLDGLVTQPMLKNIPYDVLSVGNHELYVNEITLDVHKNFVPHWKGRYLAANVYIKDATNNKTVQLGDKYAYFEGAHGTRVLSFGFLFNFNGNGNASVVRTVADEISDPWFEKALLKHKADVIVLIGHIGLHTGEFQTVTAAIRKHYPYIPITILGGHTHIRDFAIYDSWAAGIESGRYLETIGFFSVDGISDSKKFIKKHGYQSSKLPSNLTFHRRYLDQNRETYIYHTAETKKTKHSYWQKPYSKKFKFDTPLGKYISQNITNWRDKLTLSTTLGCAPQDYYLSAVPMSSNSSLLSLVVNEVLPQAVTDPSRPYPPYFIINSGSQRYDVYKGAFTLDNMYQVSPFVDRFMYIPAVPLSIVKQVLPIMNHEKVTKRSVWPHGPQPEFIESQQYIANEFANDLARRDVLTPGYTTKDDLGTDGDDTKHSQIPYHDSTTYVASPLPTGSDDTLIDLVFLDFFVPQMKTIFKSLTGKEWAIEPVYGDYERLRRLRTPYTLFQKRGNRSLNKKHAGMRIGITIIGCLVALIAYLATPSQIQAAYDRLTGKRIPDCFKYAIMIDAGSAGSRIHVYQFHQCTRADPIRLHNETLFAQTIPGLSAYADVSPQKAAESLDILLNQAVSVVPKGLQAMTPISVKATAGLRLLGNAKSEEILEAVWRRLEAEYPFPIVGGRKGVAIMDGRDEGVYAWITVNFLLGNLDNTKRQPTAAVFDLGGGSTQIVFEPDYLPNGSLPALTAGDHKYLLTYNGRDHMLYQHSYLGYGLMEMRKRIHDNVISTSTTNQDHNHPCLPRDLEWSFKTVRFIGQGSYDSCANTVKIAINKEAECPEMPCSFDGVHQPPLGDTFKHGPIYIFSYFFDRTQPLGFPLEFRLPELASLTKQVCSGAFFENVTDVELREEMQGRPEWCLDLTYMYNLLAHGYEIPDDRIINIAKKIDGVETGWCLGAAIALLDDASLLDETL
ncbi:nucleoside phosphatase family-domain-containing protein [Phycomyces nitens]|nr:nucleoside phosphatase family-domain-containing protein [Phycomyces nitens]